MRAALQRSMQVRRQADDVPYVRGAIVICTSCARPLYRLERGIAFGESVGRSIDAFAPVTVRDLVVLRDRRDIDAGVRAILYAEVSLAAYADRIPRPRTGQPALCPFCDQVFVQGRTAEAGDTHDRAFVWELVTIPPIGGIRGLAAHARQLWRNV